MGDAPRITQNDALTRSLIRVGCWAFVWALAVCAQSARAADLGAFPSLRAIQAFSNSHACHLAIYVEPNVERAWLTVGNLVAAVVALFLVLLAVSFWVWTLGKRVQEQADALTARAEAEAARVRHNAQVDDQRSHILEDINSSRPLSELIETIAESVSFSLNGAPCWFEAADGARVGMVAPRSDGTSTIRREIPARAGGSLGTLFAAVESSRNSKEEENAALESGVRLATLAIETRKLHKDLLYCSEFDLLTDIHNRLSLHRYLGEQIQKGREQDSIFGLIYINLDDFKHVNDVYGHHVGDLYLKEVSLRMKRQLRSGDMLARLGGDEFAALVPIVRDRGALDEIAQRLERCFDAPFAVEGYILRGAASVGLALYPEDGTSVDGLLGAADAAMYVSKHTKRNRAEKAGRLQKAIFRPVD